MKNIYEILTEIGVEIPEDKKSTFDEAMKANYKTVAEVEKITTARDNYKSQLETAQNVLKEFEGVDVKELQGKIETLNNDLQKKETEYQNKISDMEFNSVLDGAITKSGAKNAKAVKALLDLETLKNSKNQAEDITKALEAVKSENDFMFKSDEPFQNAVRDTGNGGGFGGNNDDAMRAVMGLPAQNKN
ncbi:MAG: phage scaffolding protein [Ruminococcus sp.]|nr:phage scaffolding protein [Ruminococcus sp.]